MNFIVQYVLANKEDVRNVIVKDCENVDEALKEFKKEYGAELAQQVISVMPTTIDT